MGGRQKHFWRLLLRPLLALTHLTLHLTFQLSSLSERLLLLLLPFFFSSFFRRPSFPRKERRKGVKKRGRKRGKEIGKAMKKPKKFIGVFETTLKIQTFWMGRGGKSLDDVESHTSPLFSALSPPAVRVSRKAAAASETPFPSLRITGEFHFSHHHFSSG